MFNERIDVGVVDFRCELSEQFLAAQIGLVIFDGIKQRSRYRVELQEPDLVIAATVDREIRRLLRWLCG